MWVSHSTWKLLPGRTIDTVCQTLFVCRETCLHSDLLRQTVSYLHFSYEFIGPQKEQTYCHSSLSGRPGNGRSIGLAAKFYAFYCPAIYFPRVSKIIVEKKSDRHSQPSIRKSFCKDLWLRIFEYLLSTSIWAMKYFLNLENPLSLNALNEFWIQVNTEYV